MAAQTPFDRVSAEIAARDLPEATVLQSAGLNKGVFSDIRRGKAQLSLNSLTAICDVLKKPVSWALGETPAPAATTGHVGEADETRILVPLEALLHSDLNPRKAFDELGDLQDLANSIEQNGVLQNLVVREFKPGAPGFGYIIVAGGRRHRALDQLANAGKWDRKAARVPVKVITADDANHLALALLENLQRKDMNPLEEAEAFKQLQALDPKKWTTAAIAQKIGFTQRHVQIRMKLATDLLPEAREALRDGKINSAQARVIVMAEPKLQKDMLKEATDPEYPADAGDLKRTVTRKWTHVSKAIFPLEGEGAPDAGEVFEGDGPGDRWFTDEKKFMAAQLAAAKHQAEQTAKAKGLAFAKKVDWFDTSEWIADKKNPKAGVVYKVDKYTAKVDFKVGFREKTQSERRQPSHGSHKETAEDKAARAAHAKRATAYGQFGAALGDAARKRPELALQLAVFSIVADIEDTDLPFEDGGVFGLYGRDRDGIEAPAKVAAAIENGDWADVWKAVCTLSEGQIAKLLAAAIATKILGTNNWMPDAPDFGPGAVCTLVAKAADIEIPDVLLPAQVDIEDAPKSKKKAAE